MYKTGDTVLHPTAGVCTVTDIKRENFAGLGQKDFYVLCPVYDNRQIIHTPVQNAKIAKIILTFIGYFTMMMKIKKVKEIYFANAKYIEI